MNQEDLGYPFLMIKQVSEGLLSAFLAPFCKIKKEIERLCRLCG